MSILEEKGTLNTIINGREYRFETKYKHNDNMRESFDQLAQLCFDGLSLERWYQDVYKRQALPIESISK